MTSLYKSFQPTLTDEGLKQFGLSLKSMPACKMLRGIVQSYLQIYTNKPTPYPIMPDGTQAIYISPNGSMIGGALTHANNVQILQAGEYFGIWFYPGALRHFFDLNLSEISNQFVDGHYFPSKEFQQLHDRIYQQKNSHDRAQVCEQWLLQNYKPLPITQFDQALSLIYQSLGNIKINHLAENIGWTSRHLNRLFRNHTGLSTKTFAQTIRIQHVCKKLYLSPDNSLQTAHESGFFDQSHLIKDCKKRLLSSPGTFFNQFNT